MSRLTRSMTVTGILSPDKPESPPTCPCDVVGQSIPLNTYLKIEIYKIITANIYIKY